MSQVISSVVAMDDREAQRKFWFVLETRMNHEKKVHEQLKKMGVTSFLPSQIVERQYRGRKTFVEQLLIPMKVFVNIELHEKINVLKLSSVIRFMYDRGKSASVIIPDYQMSQFMLMLQSSSASIELCNSALSLGMQVRVVRGPLLGLEGSFISRGGRSSVKIGIGILGSVCVEVSSEDIEIIKGSNC